jgi:hypothetical protein
MARIQDKSAVRVPGSSGDHLQRAAARQANKILWNKQYEDSEGEHSDTEDEDEMLVSLISWNRQFFIFYCCEYIYFQNLNDSSSSGCESETEESGGEESSGDSETSSFDVRNHQFSSTSFSLLGKDGTKWNLAQMNKERCGRVPAQNVFTGRSGCTAKAQRAISPGDYSSAFHLLFDDSMLRHIMKCTTKEAHRQLNNDNWETSVEEIEAFIGLLYIRGACGAAKLEADNLWSKKWGIAIFSATMPRDRFREILKFLRFDDKTTRSERLRNDKFAAISWLFYRFIENSQSAHKPGVNVTVDEQLLPSKCRCPFTQYMSNKPDKFGLKFWLLCDTETQFVQNALPYLGKDNEKSSKMQLGHHVVMELMKPYYWHGHNVTTDSFFTSLALAKDLHVKRTTLLGTVRWNRRELPKEVHTFQAEMKRFESKLLEEESHTATMTLYKSKPRKAVILFSSQHRVCHVDETHKKRLPETIASYNGTKHGVDICDQMTRLYTTKAQTRRWPMHVFYNLLDIGGINAWRLYTQVTNEKIKRSDFLLALGQQLCQRKGTVVTNKDGIDIPTRRQCQVTPHKNKTSLVCSKCQRLCCGTCVASKQTLIICCKCFQH